MSGAPEIGLSEGDTLGKRMTVCESMSSELTLRDKFVAYIQALSGCGEDRTEVWMEHSYARAHRVGSAAALRNVLVTRPPSCLDAHEEDGATVDVLSVEERPEPPLSPRVVPNYEQALSEEEIMCMSETDSELEDWEEKLDALAPSTMHRRLVSAVLDIIRSLRTARLIGADAWFGSVRSHVRRLRRELAATWNHPGPLQQRPAAWMHAVLSAYLPRPYLHLYNDMVSELARVVPKLAERLLAGQVNPAFPETMLSGLRMRPAHDRPLLVWLPSGREKRDAVWENSLCQVLPVIRISAPVVNACAPDAWCTAVAASTRSTLATLMSTPRSALVLGGCGAGAALALHIASTWDAAIGSAPKALVLYSPPLLTAEGPRDSLDDPMLLLKVPMLFVVGQNAMQCTVGTAEEIRSRMTPRPRLVVLGAADDCLRLTQFALRTQRVQHSQVYAALAEEVHNFVTRALRDDSDCSEDTDTADEPPLEPESSPCPSPAPPAQPARRRPLPQHVSTHAPSSKRQRYGLELITPPPPPTPPPVAITVAAPIADASMAVKASPNAGKGRGLALLRVSSSPIERSVLAPSPGAGRTTTDWEEALNESHKQKHEPRHRNIRITENIVTRGAVLNGNSTKVGNPYVVTRGTGSVPLSLPPPRRSAPPAPTLNTADIMKLPIVFADDDQLGLDSMTPSAQPLPTPSQAHTVNVATRRSDGGAPLKYTKVILAKRPRTVAPVSRPIIVKGGVKVLPKGLVIKRRPAHSDGSS